MVKNLKFFKAKSGDHEGALNVVDVVRFVPKRPQDCCCSIKWNDDAYMRYCASQLASIQEDVRTTLDQMLAISAFARLATTCQGVHTEAYRWHVSSCQRSIWAPPQRFDISALQQQEVQAMIWTSRSFSNSSGRRKEKLLWKLYPSYTLVPRQQPLENRSRGRR